MEKTLQSLHVINKKAKELSSNHNNSGMLYKGEQAQSLRKDALYKTKYRVLSIIKDEADEIELHKIDSSLYYCLYFSNWSFHTPEQVIEPNLNENLCVIELDNFSTTKFSDVPLSLKEALKHIKEEHGANANNFLERKYIEESSTLLFTGWEYLEY